MRRVVAYALALLCGCRTQPPGDVVQPPGPWTDQLVPASVGTAGPADCVPSYVEETCDDWVDGVDLDCDRVVDVPLVDTVRLGSLVGPFAVDALLPAVADEGLVWMPESRTCTPGAGRRVMALGFKRIHARTAAAAPPVFNLPGGPGVPPMDVERLQAVAALDLVQRITETRDLVFTEQRGMGSALSTVGHAAPPLWCGSDSVEALPQDVPLEARSLVARARSWGEGCAATLAQQGADLSAYTLLEMADDVDDLRAALGYDRIALFAGSFGTQHSLAVLRRHEAVVERAVLNGVEGLSHAVKAPSGAERAIERLSQAVAEDGSLQQAIADAGFDDLGDLMDATIRGLDAEPVTATVREPFTGSALFDVTFGGFDAQLVWREALGARSTIAHIPAQAVGLHRRDPHSLDAFAASVAELRFAPAFVAVNHVVDCRTGGTPQRWAAVQDESATTTLGNVFNLPKFGAGVCDPWGEPLPEEVRTEVVSDVPVLLVSGDLDPRTPVENAAAVLDGLSGGRILELRGVSHGFELDASASAAYTDAVVAFLGGSDALVDSIDVPLSFEAP